MTLDLDQLLAKQRAYEAQVAACVHDFQPPRIGSDRECTKCHVHELPWYRLSLVPRLQQKLAEETAKREIAEDLARNTMRAAEVLAGDLVVATKKVRGLQHWHCEDGPMPCDKDECSICGILCCPRGAFEHLWKDGCPACYAAHEAERRAK